MFKEKIRLGLKKLQWVLLLGKGMCFPMCVLCMDTETVNDKICFRSTWIITKKKMFRHDWSQLFLYMIFQTQGIWSQILELEVKPFSFLFLVFFFKSIPAVCFSPFLPHTAFNVRETLLILLWKVGKGERQCYISTNHVLSGVTSHCPGAVWKATSCCLRTPNKGLLHLCFPMLKSQGWLRNWNSWSLVTENLIRCSSIEVVQITFLTNTTSSKMLSAIKSFT